MNGPHDMGGMQCYGPVQPEINEPLFHGEWEKKAMAMTVAMGFSGQWNLDISRFARGSLPPEFYLTKSYYQIWLAGLQNLMLERGMVTETELTSGTTEKEAMPVKRVITADEIPAALAAGAPVSRDVTTQAQYKPGDRVRTLNINPEGHTRLPRYVRGKTGVIAQVHGTHVFPDSNAAGHGEDPQWLYAVEFDATELFGHEAEAGNTVLADCWEPYLERI